MHQPAYTARYLLAVLIVVSLAATGVAPAHADEYPGQQATSSPLLAKIEQAGEAWWRVRGIHAVQCPHGIARYVADDLRDIDTEGSDVEDVLGRGGDCELFVRHVNLLQVRHELRSHWPISCIRVDLQELISTLWHEMGHAYGLDHSAWPAQHFVPFTATRQVYFATPEGFDSRWESPYPPLTNEQAAKLMDGGTDMDTGTAVGDEYINESYIPREGRKLATAIMRDAGAYRRHHDR